MVKVLCCEFVVESNSTTVLLIPNLRHNALVLMGSNCFWISTTGTPLIGRFLGPRKNRLNRNPSY